MKTLASATSRERAVFLAVLKFASGLDGETYQEHTFIDTLAQHFSATEDEIKVAEQPRDREQVLALLSYVSTEKTKLEIIRELFFLGYADGELTENELLFITEVGNGLKVSDDVMEEISCWVIAGLEWQEEGERIFGEQVTL